MNWIGADGMEGFVDHTNENILYGTSQNGFIYKSINAGQSWSPINRPSGSKNWVTSFLMDPSNHNTIYLGLNNLYKSTYGGLNWTIFLVIPG